MDKYDSLIFWSMIVILVLPIILLIIERTYDRLEQIMRNNSGFVIYRHTLLWIIMRCLCFFSSIALAFYYIFYGLTGKVVFESVFVFFAVVCGISFIGYVVVRSFRVCFLSDCIIDRGLFKKGLKIYYKDIKYVVKGKLKLVLKDKHKNVLKVYLGNCKELEARLKERCRYEYEK